MSLSSLTTAVIVLELCSIILLSLLLATPAPKHPMVKSLMVACLLRSVLDVLPPIAEKAKPDDFKQLSNPALISFCVSDSVLLRYVTVVKAAFAVSFTLPALWLAIIQIRPKRSADDYPRLTGRTVMALCAAPFVWALPVLVVPIPKLIRGEIIQPRFNINSCYFKDNAFTIVSLIFTLIPLASAVIISCSIVFVVSRWSKTAPNLRAAHCSKRSARFGALVLVTVISASFYTVVLTLWVEGHDGWKSTWPFQLSVLWEAITPFLFFLIFAAQDEIYETWLGWLSRIIHIPNRTRDDPPEDSAGTQQYVTYHSYISPGPSHPTYSKVPHDVPVPTGRHNPSFPGRILSRPMSMKITHYSQYSERRHYGPPLGADGLSPPPRSQRFLRAQVAEEPLRPTQPRFPPSHSASLTAFGSQPSMFSQLNSSSAGDFSGEESGLPTTTAESLERIPREGRSDTPMSTRTFGRTTTSRR